MREQLSMFDNDGFAKPKTGSLALAGWRGGRLTNAQRTFNRLTAQVEALRSQLEARARELDRALAEYGEHLHPRLQRETVLRKKLVLAFGPFLRKERLKQKEERHTLRRLLEQQFHLIIDFEGMLTDPELKGVFHQVTGMSFDKVLREEAEELRDAFESMFSDLGVDVDVSDFGPGMSEEDMAAAAARIAEGFQARVEQDQSSPRRDRPKSERQLKREERERQAEELRRKSIASIYKQLAKVLHPDLERDAGRRQQKEAVMQQLTAAYRNHDLHTLLRLELEWIRCENGDLDRMTEDKLSIYNDVLKEQTIELERQLDEMVLHPRYQPVVVPDGPFDVCLRDVAEEVRRSEETISSFESLLARMEAGDSFASVRSAIRGFREEERPAQRAYGPKRGRRRNLQDVPF